MPSLEGTSSLKSTYLAYLLGNSSPLSWDKNILEVVLQKDSRGSFNVGDEDCARLIKKLGLDPRPGIHVEAIQICPNGRGVILITLRKEVPADRFCSYDVIEVTSTGIRAVLVRQCGKRESIVTIKGIHPNTRDEIVTDYLVKFGRLVSTKVIHAVFQNGPLKGFKNGDRSFKVEFKQNVNMGTYHVIDGQKVTVRYLGQQQTCARCHQTGQHCPGKGVAKKCEAAGGAKVELTDHVLNMWKEIGYTPRNYNLEELPDGAEGDQVAEQVGGDFTPAKANSDPTKFTGVCVKTFPKEIDHGLIMEFIIQSGLAEDKKSNVKIRDNGSVLIEDLTSTECSVLIGNIHLNDTFGRKLFCNGVIALTPVKPSITTDQDYPQVPSSVISQTTLTRPSTPASQGPGACTTPSPPLGSNTFTRFDTSARVTGSPGYDSTAFTRPSTVTNTAAFPELCTTAPTSRPCSPRSTTPPPSSRSSAPTRSNPTPFTCSQSTTVPSPAISTNFPNVFLSSVCSTTSLESPICSPNQSLLGAGAASVKSLDFFSGTEVARRHSLSMRDIPRGSLAAELHDADLERRKSLLNDIRDLSKKLSDFESCQSSLSSDSSEVEHEEHALEEFQTMNQKRRGWRKKRKASQTPEKTEFLKKVHQAPSPV